MFCVFINVHVWIKYNFCALFLEHLSVSHQVEHLENEACLHATPEKKGNSTELPESDQHKTDWEGNANL